jgi:hypothetical protein
MAWVFQATTTLAVTLFALVVPVFVLSVSLLGQALEKSRRDRERADQEQKLELDKEISGLKHQLEEKTLEADVKRVSELAARIARLSKRRKRVVRAAGRSFLPLSLWGAVVCPGGAFLVAIVLANAGAGLYNPGPEDGPLQAGTLLLGTSALVLTYGLYRMVKTLMVVQDVAVVSEETVLRKTVDAFKQAQQELEEARKPILVFNWETAGLPVEVPCGKEQALEYSVGLTRGDVGARASVWFFAPEGFGFPAEKRTVRQPPNLGHISGMITARVPVASSDDGQLLPGIWYRGRTTLLAPGQPGRYTLFYQVECVGYAGDQIPFDVIVI